MKQHSYKTVNLIFAIVFGLILFYFFIVKLTGIDFLFHSAYNLSEVASTGLQRSLSEMTFLNYTKAYEYNPNGPGIYLFIVIQCIGRVLLMFIGAFRKGSKNIIWADIITSSLLFFFIFRNFILLLF